MAFCPRCSKRVFFAEQTTSLGREWHVQCLKCTLCQTELRPGQHAEHNGSPYCQVPCYKIVFGSSPTNSLSRETDNKLNFSNLQHPELSIRSSLNNNSVNVSMSTPLKIDGKAPTLTAKELNTLEINLQSYNHAHPYNYVTLYEKNGSVTLEGSLRIHWGIQTPIRFVEDNSDDTPHLRVRRGRRVAKAQSFHNDLEQEEKGPLVRDPFQTIKDSGIPADRVSAQELLAVKLRRGQFHTVRASKLRRRVSINGHLYAAETSSNFTPPFGSATKLFVSSHQRSSQVVEKLLNKFKIENSPNEFAFYIVKVNGEMWPLKDDAFLLMERIVLNDTGARIFFMDRPEQAVSRRSSALEPNLCVWKPVEENIPQEVADYANLPDPMLQAFLRKFEDERATSLIEIREKYSAIEMILKQLMAEKQLTQETYL